MSNDKILKLIDTTLVKTTQNKADWREGAPDYSYDWSLPTFTVRIEYVPATAFSEEYYELGIIDSQGKKIETTTSINEADNFSEAHAMPYSYVLAELYKEAQRKESGIDEALDVLLSEIEESGS